MAMQSVTQLLAQRTAALKNGKTAVDLTPVERVLAEKKANTSTTVNFFKSEPYFKAKANQLKYMMALYSNLGLEAEYKVMEAEATKVVKEYLKLYGKPKTEATTDKTA